MVPRIKIAPSILSADFARLGEQVADVEKAGADQIHLDIMDGHFVPNLSVGPAVVEAVHRITRLPLDVHLMVSDPAIFLVPFANAGASSLTVHVEIESPISDVIGQIHELGLRAGVAIKPDTNLQTLENVLASVDIVLVMTVEPGFGGQKFMESSTRRIAEVRHRLSNIHSNADLAVDGGIDHETAPRAISAGATVLVAGSAIFDAPEGISAAMRRMPRSETDRNQKGP